MGRQLNIRSDKASDIARRMSAHLGLSSTRVVEEALEAFEQAHRLPSKRVTREEAASFRRELLALVDESNAKRTRPLDETELYDSFGLPK